MPTKVDELFHVQLSYLSYYLIGVVAQPFLKALRIISALRLCYAGNAVMMSTTCRWKITIQEIRCIVVDTTLFALFTSDTIAISGFLHNEGLERRSERHRRIVSPPFGISLVGFDPEKYAAWYGFSERSDLSLRVRLRPRQFSKLSTSSRLHTIPFEFAFQ